MINMGTYPALSGLVVFLFICPSVHLTVRSAACPSGRLSVHPSVCLSIRPSVRPSVRPFGCALACPCIRPSTSPYVWTPRSRNIYSIAYIYIVAHPVNSYKTGYWRYYSTLKWFLGSAQFPLVFIQVKCTKSVDSSGTLIIYYLTWLWLFNF